MPPPIPDFFIVGHRKCGTSALYQMLRGHPQICMSSVKEPRFLETKAGDPPLRRPENTGRTPATLEEYLALFAAATPGQRIGDASPSYLLSPASAARIAELQPEARIIAILREPASYLRSFHLQQLRIHSENEKDLRRAIELEPERREGRHLPPTGYWPEILQYSQHVRYVEQLERYRANFAPEQILVLIYDDLRRDNQGTVQRILRFLDVDETHPIRAREANQARAVRSQRAYDLIHAAATGEGTLARGVRSLASKLAPERLTRERALAIRDRIFYSKPPPSDEQLMSEMRQRFKPEVVAASEYLGRDLVSLWGYDRID